MKTTRLIGAHVSASGGIDKAVKRATAIGCNSVQVFSGSPRMWRRKALADLISRDNLAKISAAQRAGSHQGPIITHAMYLVNLASPNPEQVSKSINVIGYDLAFDAAVKGGGVVVHLGSHLGAGWDAVKEQVRDAIKQLLTVAPAEATFLIENSAGQNGKLSSNFAEIRWLMDELNSPQLGWCFDTCHAHAAGYGLGHSQAGSRGNAAEQITKFGLWESLKVIHVNDSRDPFDSGRDRHANLGEGQLDQQQLQEFLMLPELQYLPLILEVPGQDDQGPDAANVEQLKALIN